MKKYSQLFLLSSTILGVFSAQLTAQASEADNAQKSSNPATLASNITVNVSGNTASINYTRSQTQVPYTIYHAVWSDENGQDDIKWYSAPQTPTTAIDLRQHTGYGTFHVHTYININGKMVGLNGTTFKVEKPASGTVSTTVLGKTAQISFTRNKDQTNANILHAVWSDEKGQDDIKWYTAGQDTTEIDLSNHKGYGVYHVHTYENKNGKMIGLNGTTFNLEKPNPTIQTSFPEPGIMDIQIKNVPETIYKLTVPAWSDRNGQDDLQWYAATNHGDGTFTAAFDIRNHQVLSGTYTNHIYVKYKDGSEHSYATDSVAMSAEKIKTKVSVAKRSTYLYEVTVTDAYGDGKISLPTWSEVNGQDDIQWYTATKAGNGIYKFTIDTQKHTGSGLFHTHVYRNLNGQMIGLTGTSYQVEKPAISFQPNYAAATTYPKGQCTWGAKALAPWAGNYWGNGGDWAASARRAGFKTGTTPQVGAIICWTDGGYGHVGVVTHVASNTRIQIQETNYAGKQYIGNFRGWFNPHAAGQGAVSYIYPK